MDVGTNLYAKYAKQTLERCPIAEIVVGSTDSGLQRLNVERLRYFHHFGRSDVSLTAQCYGACTQIRIFPLNVR